MQYTQSQILCGIREVWQGFGFDSIEPIEPSNNIIESIKASGEWEELDLADLFKEIDEYFRIERPMSEWEEFFGFWEGKKDFREWETNFAPKLTIAALIQFIAKRLTYVSLAPAVVAGKTCAPAGVFYGIEKIVNEIAPVRFAPSTKIRSVLSRKSLDELWRQLNWMTGLSLPRLPDGHRMLGCLAIPVMILGALASYLTGEIVVFGLGLGIALICFVAMQICEDHLDPLPPNIKTFRDLAVFLSKIDCDATRVTS